ncbi:MAG TPA: DUF3570 domain-containing protein, partial [Myxococcota bacterium]|nr:DUF3570 domain-containing protein [Myxococcota bacterium]
MAATRGWIAAPRSPSLRALTAAALALPGLAPGRAQGAEDDEVSFQYGRYTEDDRDLSGVDSAFDPIRADNLMAEARFSLIDRWSLAFMYEQDTWSGATPVTTAPLVMGGNRPTSPDGVSGATPFIEGDLFFDGRLHPLRLDEFGEPGSADTSLVHTLASASPETRQQFGATLGYAFEERPLELSLGGGYSLESDYESAFGELGGAWEFDQGRFRLEASTSYTHNETDALLDPDAVPYIDTSAYDDDVEVFSSTGNRKLSGDSDEVGLRLALSRILNRNTLVKVGFGYARASGFLENPYKVVEVAFIDPAQQGQAPPGGSYAQVHALLEQRPNSRNQWSADARLVQYVSPLDAALQLSYGFYADDWGIDAHTFEASWGQPLGWGFTLTPRIRFYSQSQADFYEPYLISQQAYRTIVTDPDSGDILSITPFDPSLLPSHFSSDARLSGFGSLSSGATLSLRFARGIVLDGGFEYAWHRGDWELGGGGEGDYADFDYYVLSAGLRFDTSALAAFAAAEAEGDAEAEHAMVHAHTDLAPAGVMLGHMLDTPGDWMFGLRYGYARQDGDVLRGTRSADDDEIAARGCDDIPCVTAPKTMTMQMIMVDVSYAATSWLNLMLMPSFVALKMDVRPLDSEAPDPQHSSHDHESGGVGDTGMFALVEVLEAPGHELHAGLGLSAPTGKVDEKTDRSHQQEDAYTHYGMQLGSGTWDFLPSLTYNGAWRRLSFGAQLSGTVRLEDENDSGYALGDVFQATGWAGFALTRWLSATARGLYTWQGHIRHQYDRRHDES